MKGLIQLQLGLLEHSILGFQWLDGSFVENVEALRGRGPNDVDVVTFVRSGQENITDALLNQSLIKTN